MIDASSSHEPKLRIPLPSGIGANAASTVPDPPEDDEEDEVAAAGALVDGRLLWPKAFPCPLPCAAAGAGTSSAQNIRARPAAADGDETVFTDGRPSSCAACPWPSSWLQSTWIRSTGSGCQRRAVRAWPPSWHRPKCADPESPGRGSCRRRPSRSSTD